MKTLISFLSILLIGWNSYSQQNKNALKEIIKNQPELEAVINHYKKEGNQDKLRAASFLIVNMKGKVTYSNDLVDSKGISVGFNISIGNVTQSGNEAETKMGINHDTANIVLNQDYINGTDFQNRPTDLSIANTIAHEIIHAYLISITKAYQYHNEQELLNIEIICEAYEEYLKTNDPYISVNAHHEYIADKYVNTIAATIKEFHTGSSSYSLTGLEDQIYRDLAWSGLFNTDIFNEKYPNDPSHINYAERTRIINRFYAERNGQNWGQSVTQGTPCEK